MTKAEFAARLKHGCTSVMAAEGELTEIDSRFGDADHGLTMTKIAKAIDQAVEQAEGGIQAMLDDAAMAVMTLNGGSAVPLWNTWLDGLQKDAPVGDEIDVDGLKAIFAKALEELSDMSGAKVGDKTMMDALIPASQAIAAYTGDEVGLFAAAARAAAEGAETITDEELTGLGLAYPDILDVDGHLVISKDLANADQVTIVTYGGSGHEPAQAGFVGKGMLDVQAVGDIFAAPNGQLVFDAMKLADKGHGVLLLTLNYAGDQLAGKQAMKLAQKAGLNVRQVVTGEEIQYDPNGEDNKRGLAGAVALYHIAAAAAREGKSLDEVAAIAQRYADSMASVTVKSTDATHPQNGMSFGDLGETDLMEIGAGQHGEGGGIRVPMMSAKDTVATVAQALCKNLELKAGDKAFVMINGCGATTMMEMLVLFKDTVEYLKAMDVEVVASMVGEILTVQEAGGFQMNIAKWDEEFIRLWNTPCHTPAYSKE